MKKSDEIASDGRASIHPDSAFGQKLAAQHHRDKAYDQRDEVISALSKQFPGSHLMRVEGRMNYDHAVCIHLPTGRVTWRVSSASIDRHFGHLPKLANDWESRSTHKTRSERLLALPNHHAE